MNDKQPKIERREFLDTCLRKAPAWFLTIAAITSAEKLFAQDEQKYDPTGHNYAMGVDVHKCIGCGRCADACKKENDVPREPTFFRT